MALDNQDLALLNKPFVASDHKFLGDLIYLHEEPIAERLDLVDPAWSFQIQSITTRPNAGEGGKDVATVTVHASLIVKNVARHGVGMAVVQKTNPIAETKWENGTKKNTGNFYTSEANEAEKSAVTDALKRCARMFGIGRYLLTIPKNTVKDAKQLEKWLKDTYGDFQLVTKPVYHDDSTAPQTPDFEDFVPDSTNPILQAWNKEQMGKFWNKWHKKDKIEADTILTALGVAALGEFQGSLSDADKAMRLYIEKIK